MRLKRPPPVIPFDPVKVISSYAGGQVDAADPVGSAAAVLAANHPDLSVANMARMTAEMEDLVERPYLDESDVRGIFTAVKGLSKDEAPAG